MTEIEKLYENAGIRYINLNTCKIDETGKNGKCKTIFYPEFTARKQIELIKWLAKTRPVHIACLLDNWIIEGFVRYGKKYDSFESALAGLINNHWKNLTDTEKAEIKRILE